MSRFFVTGDKHGDYHELEKTIRFIGTTKEDFMIVLGDHGTTYYGPTKDKKLRKKLNELPITFIMIRGNHDQRPSKKVFKTIYLDNDDIKGAFFYDPDTPSILYTREFGWYIFAGHPVFVIGGAASVDKQFRLEQQELGHKSWRWFYDEELSIAEMNEAKDKYIEGLLYWCDTEKYIMSHTCPLRYQPYEKLLPDSDVDNVMEIWMNEIEETTFANERAYSKWFCGHYHTDKTIDNMRFMFEDVIELE